MLSSAKKYFASFNPLKFNHCYLIIFSLILCFKLSAQQIILNNLKQIPNAYICYDGATKKVGLQSLDRKTQLLPMEYDEFFETGKFYARYVKMSKNEAIGVYDCLSSQILIKPIYHAIDIKEFPQTRSSGKYYKDTKNYFITSNYIEKHIRNKGLYDGNGEVLACEYESINLLNSGPTGSVTFFTVRKRQGPLQIYDYTHRQFLPQTFSNLEPEPASNGKTRYKVTVNGKTGIVDAHFNWVIEPNYKEILIYDQYNHHLYPAGEKFIYVLKLTDSTWTFTNYTNPKITADQPHYTEVRNYNEYVNVYKGKKLGLVNLEHKQILPYEYQELSPFDRSPNLWTAYANKHYGIVNIKNEKLTPFKYTAIQEIKPPYVLLYTNEIFTIFNVKTRKMDSRVFKSSGFTNYDESLYILSAQLNNKVVLLDSNLVIKKTLVDPPMEQEYGTTMDTDNSDWRNSKSPDFAMPPEPQRDGGNGEGPGGGRKTKTTARYTVINAGKLQGVMDNESGKEIVKPIYKKIITKQNAAANGIINFVGYQQDNEFGVIDLKTGNTLFSDEMSALLIKKHGPGKQNLIYFELEYAINNSIRKAIADTSGILTKPLYDQVSSFSDNGTLLSLSYYENKIRYTDLYDLDNKKYLIKKTQEVRNISTMTRLNNFLVIKDSLYGVINQKGGTVIPIKYKYLSFDSDDKLLKSSNKLGIAVNKKNKYAALVIDKNARVNLTSFYDSIYHGVNDLAIAKKNNKYGLVNVTTSKKVLALDKQSISIRQANPTKTNSFIYVADKELHYLYDADLKLLTKNSDSILYAGANTFAHLQKSGYKLYNTLTASVGAFNYSFLSLLNDNELFVIRNDSVFTINSNEEVLRLWDTKYSSHTIAKDNYSSKELLISDFAKSLEFSSTEALMQWCKNVAPDLTLNHYFESKKINDRIINKTGSELKSVDTQKNAEALYSVYNKLYEALHEMYNNDFVIEEVRLITALDGTSKNSVKNKSNNTYQYYYEPVISFKIKNTYYHYKMGFLFNEFSKLYVYPNEPVRTR